MPKKSIAMLMVLAAVTAGCGGEDDKAATGKKSLATSQSSPTATPVRADTALAESGVLKLSDFPAGWEAEAPDKDDDDDVATRHSIAECVGIAYEDLYNLDSEAKADSKDFSNENDDEISNSVTVNTDEIRAESRFAILATQKYRDCTLAELQKYIKKAAKDGDFEVGEASLNEISFDKFGDESSAFRATIPIKVDGMSAETVLDYVFVRIGRVVTGITAQSTVTTISASELATYVKIAADRLAGELN